MMNYLKAALIFVLSFAALGVLAQTDSIVLKNKTVARIFYFDKQAPGFYTGSYRNLVAGVEYARPGTEEFGIENGRIRHRDKRERINGEKLRISSP